MLWRAAAQSRDTNSRIPLVITSGIVLKKQWRRMPRLRMVHCQQMRRMAVLAAVVAAVAAGVFIWQTHARKPHTIDGPIVLISIDTLRADHLPI